MERYFEKELKSLLAALLEMGGNVERAIWESTSMLLKRQTRRFDEVMSYEQRINDAHMELDDRCVQILARQNPKAKDLRFIVAVLKINTDLERMGDLAVSMAYNARGLVEAPIRFPERDFTQMTKHVMDMVRCSLDAFVQRDVELANSVLAEDDRVDDLKKKITHEVAELAIEDIHGFESHLKVSMVAICLERMGDHATNIAEDAIFATTGDDVRHSGARGRQAST